MEGDAPFDDDLPDDLVQYLQGFNSDFSAQLSLFPPPLTPSLFTPTPPPPLPPPPAPAPPPPPPPPPPSPPFILNAIAPPIVEPLVAPQPYHLQGAGLFGLQPLDAGSSSSNPGGNFVGGVSYPTWIVLQRSDCFPGCILLREVVHGNAGSLDQITSAQSTWKILIHGGHGQFYHAILHVVNSPSGPFRNYFADLRPYPPSVVKRFLLDYGEARKREGLVVVSDSLNEFYDALCVGLDFDASQRDRDLSYISNDSEMLQAAKLPGPSRRPMVYPKTHIAAQRERSENLSLEEISAFFHLPIAEASEKLRLCTTALKKACRRNGLQRWPYRKVNSAQKAISRMKRSLQYQSGDAAVRTEEEITKTRDKMHMACEGALKKIKRIEETIDDLQEKMKSQSREEAARTAAEITMLRDKIRSYRNIIIKKGKAPMQD